MGDGIAPGEIKDEVKDETEDQTQRMDFSAASTGGSVAHRYAGLRPDSRLAMDSEPDAVSSEQQMPQTTASVRNTSNAMFVADGICRENQMPQMPVAASNATNATMESIEDVDFSVVVFAQPTGWGKLWRIERNGNYFIYRLRFVDSKDTPKEYRRITRKGGKLTPQIEAKLEERKGRGRHAESRADADRFRSRAFDLAKRIRASR